MTGEDLKVFEDRWGVEFADARPGFSSILHAVTPHPDGYVSRDFRRKQDDRP